MIVIRNDSKDTLAQAGDTRVSFSALFRDLIEKYGYGDRVKPEKRKNTLGLQLGVGGAQITRYAQGVQMPS